jgi:hypothetical protein
MHAVARGASGGHLFTERTWRQGYRTQVHAHVRVQVLHERALSGRDRLLYLSQ